MQFINIIIIEQQPNGDTRLIHELRNEGDGQPSARMAQAKKDFYNTFGQFLSRYANKPAALITAQSGRLTFIEAEGDDHHG